MWWRLRNYWSDCDRAIDWSRLCEHTNETQSWWNVDIRFTIVCIDDKQSFLACLQLRLMLAMSYMHVCCSEAAPSHVQANARHAHPCWLTNGWPVWLDVEIVEHVFYWRLSLPLEWYTRMLTRISYPALSSRRFHGMLMLHCYVIIVFNS